MSDELERLHRLIKQEQNIADKCRHNPYDDDYQKKFRLGFISALDYVEHEIRMMLEQRESENTDQIKTIVHIADTFANATSEGIFVVLPVGTKGEIIKECSRHSGNVFVHFRELDKMGFDYLCLERSYIEEISGE